MIVILQVGGDCVEAGLSSLLGSAAAPPPQSSLAASLAAGDPAQMAVALRQTEEVGRPGILVYMCFVYFAVEPGRSFCCMCTAY